MEPTCQRRIFSLSIISSNFSRITQHSSPSSSLGLPHPPREHPLLSPTHLPSPYRWISWCGGNDDGRSPGSGGPSTPPGLLCLPAWLDLTMRGGSRGMAGLRGEGRHKELAQKHTKGFKSITTASANPQRGESFSSSIEHSQEAQSQYQSSRGLSSCEWNRDRDYRYPSLPWSFQPWLQSAWPRSLALHPSWCGHPKIYTSGWRQHTNKYKLRTNYTKSYQETTTRGELSPSWN
jgi:hypothetical protein